MVQVLHACKEIWNQLVQLLAWSWWSLAGEICQGICNVCCCLVTQLCLTLCNPMDCSMPDFPVLHHLLELAQTHIHWVSEVIQPSCPLSFSSCLLSFPASECFLRSQFFVSGGQSIGVSASASVLPMNIQDWFPLGWTGWIFLQSKGLSKVFSNTTIQKHVGLSFLYSPTLTSVHGY